MYIYIYCNNSKTWMQRKTQERESVSLRVSQNSKRQWEWIWPSLFHSCMHSFVKSFRDHELFQGSKFFGSFQPSGTICLPLEAIYRIYWKPLHCKVWRYHRIYRMRGDAYDTFCRLQLLLCSFTHKHLFWFSISFQRAIIFTRSFASHVE
jgi:hypothetical protein